MTDTLAEPPSERARVRRAASRGSYDTETVHAILDAGRMGHVGLVADGRPVVIPMLYGRDGDHLYLHGSVASRLMRGLAGGLDTCLTVTLLDAYVLARSAFHHSLNYRSVVVFGVAEPVTGDEAVHGVRCITEHLVPGRWDEVRAPSDVEMRQTSVLRMPIAEASAKVRGHGVVDEPEDIDLPIWAGVLPLRLAVGDPVADEALAPGLEVPPSVLRLDSAHV
ncbi:MAG: pyridoxamine 5'-phosphate oxidase family protein [Acidimicrobiia bacterium]|nr:pyridoxamine 5'-phosphate oxidase family protein [Acidimicrobiia bacterium]